MNFENKVVVNKNFVDNSQEKEEPIEDDKECKMEKEDGQNNPKEDEQCGKVGCSEKEEQSNDVPEDEEKKENESEGESETFKQDEKNEEEFNNEDNDDKDDVEDKTTTIKKKKSKLKVSKETKVQQIFDKEKKGGKK